MGKTTQNNDMNITIDFIIREVLCKIISEIKNCKVSLDTFQLAKVEISCLNILLNRVVRDPTTESNKLVLEFTC